MFTGLYEGYEVLSMECCVHLGFAFGRSMRGNVVRTEVFALAQAQGSLIVYGKQREALARRLMDGEERLFSVQRERACA